MSAVVVNLCLMPAEELVGSTYLSRKTNEKTVTEDTWPEAPGHSAEIPTEIAGLLMSTA